MEEKYWENYYKIHRQVSVPTLFAEFALENYMDKSSSLIELGCGNGRDAVYFAENGMKVLAVDQCQEEISYLNKNNQNNKLNFLKADFTDLGNLGLFDNVYSRFTLHSVSEKESEKTLNWAYSSLNGGGKILIEVRGQKNELYGLGTPVEDELDAFIYDGHYRRFINFEDLCSKLINIGFKIIFAKEKAGFAPFAGSDQVFIRVIATKS